MQGIGKLKNNNKHMYRVITYGVKMKIQKNEDLSLTVWQKWAGSESTGATIIIIKVIMIQQPQPPQQQQQQHRQEQRPGN